MDPQLSLCPWCSPGLPLPSWPTPPTARHRLPPIALPRAVWSPPHIPPTPRHQHQILARHADLSPGASAPASSLPATPSLPCLSQDPQASLHSGPGLHLLILEHSDGVTPRKPPECTWGNVCPAQGLSTLTGL